MRTYILAASAMIMLFLATTNAYAIQFSFDPSTGNPYRQTGSGLPAIIVAIAAVVGALIIVGERKKAKGIWFSNNERLK